MGTFVSSAAFALALVACSAKQTPEGDATAAGGSASGAPGSGGTLSFGGGGGAGVGTGGNLGSGGNALSGGSSAGGSQAGSSGNTSGGNLATLGGRSSAGEGGASQGNAGQVGAAGTTAAAGASNGGYRWGAVALGGGGFVSAVVASLSEKNVFFARTDVGGFYRWNEASSSWLPLTNFVSDAQTGFLGVESVALDPQAPGRVYALVGIDYFNGGKSAILRSTDNGDSFAITDVTAHFKAHGNGMGRQNGERLAVDPNLGNVLFCGTRRNGLWKSSDFGATWQAASGLPVTTTANDNGVALVLFDAASGARGSATPRLFAGISRLNAPNFYVSSNGGASFNPVPGAPPTTQMPQRAAIASNGTLYITFANGAGPHGNTSGSEPMDVGLDLEVEHRARHLDEHHSGRRQRSVQRHQRRRTEPEPPGRDHHQHLREASLGLRRPHLRQQRRRQQLVRPIGRRQGNHGRQWHALDRQPRDSLGGHGDLRSQRLEPRVRHVRQRRVRNQQPVRGFVQLEIHGQRPGGNRAARSR
ncbi:MAG: sialidase family protein [Polyangiaceae bacterium]